MSERKDSATDRTRRHPEERFAPDAQAFDLDLTAIELARETTTGHARHRQKTLYRHGGSSLALFLFEAGAELREHRTSGTVFVQVLRGRLSVNAGGRRHELPAGRVLVMAPGVPHDLRAEEATQMLLTVSLQADKTDGKH